MLQSPRNRYRVKIEFLGDHRSAKNLSYFLHDIKFKYAFDMIRHEYIAPCPGSARASRASDRPHAVGTHARLRASFPRSAGNESRYNKLSPAPSIRHSSSVIRHFLCQPAAP